MIWRQPTTHNHVSAIFHHRARCTLCRMPSKNGSETSQTPNVRRNVEITTTLRGRKIHAVYVDCQNVKEFRRGKSPKCRKFIEAMTKYNQELAKDGIRIMAKRLHPSANGIRISHPNSGEKPVVTCGPFSESNDLIAGFILIAVNSKEEAVEWAMLMPDPQGYGEGQIELRQVFDC